MASTTNESGSPTTCLDAVVIGAGFAGLYQLHALRDQLGLDVIAIEAGEGVGGTWYWNRYPGARCDSESFTYCYSFSRELQEQWSWTERYPVQKEILAYLNHVADRFDLRKDIRFNSRVTTATYDESNSSWLIETSGGQRLNAKFLIMAVGTLSTANFPNIPGLETFAGRWFHTSDWPEDELDFSGQRVGLIGTGSSGIQTAPIIAKQAEQLTVFQRTPNYSLPAHNHKLSDDFQLEIRANYEAIRDLARSTFHGHAFEESKISALDVDDEERVRRYEFAWGKGGLRFLNAFSDLFYNVDANQTASSFVRRKIAEVVHDPETATALMPVDYPIGARRPTTDTGFYEMFNRENVSLVDIRRSPIVEIIPTGVRTTDQVHSLDVIVLATGFDALTGPLLAIDIRGRDGRSLRADWQGGPITLLGLQTPGYPNLFIITGPGSPSVLANAPVAIEQHVDWITDCILKLLKSGHAHIEATEKAADEWSVEMDRAAQSSLLPLAPSSWYMGGNIPGKPSVVLPYAGGMLRYAQIAKQVADENYRGFLMG
jgi:cation diffusion facilitator CzcD-associated flavoprotein CzcO